VPGHPLRPSELAFVHEARVGHLATVDLAGHPVVIPVCFTSLDLEGDPAIVTVLDEKPKRVADRDLARVRNIAAHPHVALVVDHYDEDWTQLAFVQIHGEATLIDPGEPHHAEAIAVLRAKYPQYHAMRIEHRPVILITHLSASSWRADGTL
jgi:PPOX class probable F420-dependent enzyme